MTDSPVRIVPLGGLGEIGRNMMVLEHDDDIVVIDAGVMFPGEGMHGIDFIIPDMTYLIENKDKIRAVLITHGHEDHIGALPYLLQKMDVPVYASRLTHGLITVKLKEHGRLRGATVNVVEPHVPFKLGTFRVEFFRVCHSIPDAMGIAVTTPVGMIIHTGDFKIDHTPADGKPTDFGSLARLSSEGVLLLCSDSTYAEVEGYTASEQTVGEALTRVVGEATGRVMVATFASLISRIQQVIDAAVEHGRKVTFVGRSMMNNSKMAMEMGYLKAPQGTVVPLKQARQLPPDEVVILATGAQGEPTSALVRIANGEHQDIEIVPNDTVVISASPIPGNETLVAKTIDNLYRQGATVLYSRTSLVHVHGHGSREELKMMLNLIRPKFFVPVHGEYRHLVAHASLAHSSGIPESNTFVLEDGDVLELTAEAGSVEDKVTADPVFVEGGRRMWDAQDRVPGDHKGLVHNGIIMVLLTFDGQTNRVLRQPNLMSAGFIEMDESRDLYEKTSQKARSALEQILRTGLDLSEANSEIARSVSDFIYTETRRRPTVLAHIEVV